MIGRRALLRAGGLLLAGGRFASDFAAAAADVADIRMVSDDDGETMRFEPVGLLVRPGQTIRWTCESFVHTTAAYHPRNDSHSLRIPLGAEPWGSDYLQPGESFEVTLTVEGVYDYFCAPHEEMGMVGRIVVGRPAGPGLLDFDYFKLTSAGRYWREVPEAARTVFPSAGAILEHGAVRLA